VNEAARKHPFEQEVLHPLTAALTMMLYSIGKLDARQLPFSRIAYVRHGSCRLARL